VRGPKTPVDLAGAALKTFATNDRVNRFLVENLSEEVWREPIPGGRGKTIAAIVAHMHNCRCMWVKALGKRAGWPVPAHLDRRRVTRAQAVEGFKASRDAVVRVLEFGLANGGKVPGFPPDVVHFLCYLVAHEAHHRGQICMLARQLGHPLSREVSYGLWHWPKRSKEDDGP
jgi:uncharacterized damage-inducible protein DinB